MANGIFDITQTDAQLQAILNKIQPLATTGDMATLGFGYGVCETAGATAAKTVSITNTVLTPGGIIAVNFVNAFTASSPTLSVNGSAAKPIKLFGNAMPMGKVKNNTIRTLDNAMKVTVMVTQKYSLLHVVVTASDHRVRTVSGNIVRTSTPTT